MKLPYKFGKYQLDTRIAVGGMAEIYKARYFGEGGFVKDVAVKRILPAWSDNRDFLTMLCDEAKALVCLQHQNIVQIYELGKDAETYYISMEFVDGVDLRRLFKKAQLPIKFACFIIQEVLKGLDCAHTRKGKNGLPFRIVHRDISPQNILLSFSGEVKIADFGIAKGKHRSFETVTSQVKGKYAYMSPEQAAGKDIDDRCDLYAAGVVLYELITKKRLYNGPNDLVTIEDVKRSVLPQDWEKDVPMGIRPIIRRALMKDIGERYQSSAEFLQDVNKFVTANKLVTHGIELSAYLKEALNEEYRASVSEADAGTGPAGENDGPQTRIMSVISNTCREGKRIGRKGSVILASWLVFSVLAGLVAWGYYKNGAANPPDAGVSPVRPPATVAAARPGLPVLPPPPAKSKEPERPALLPVPKAAPAPARLSDFSAVSVQARPWGYVYIPGHVSRAETPLKNVKLTPGDYVVKVNYEPDDRWLQQKITLAQNSRIACVADFGSKKNMTCKTVP